MDSQWKRFWETGLFPSLEFSLSLSIGYIFSLFFYVSSGELALIDKNDASFPILQMLLFSFFGIGFVYRKYIPSLPKGQSIGLLISSSFLFYWFSSGNTNEFLIDYIFSFELVLLTGSFCAFFLGIYTGSLKDYRFLSFVLGVTSFTFYSLFDPNQNYSIKKVLSVLIALLCFYFAANLFQKSTYSSKYYKIRSKIGKHPLFSPFYRSAMSLLIAYCLLHLYFQPGPKIPLILSISFSVLFGRFLSLFSGLKKETKTIFLIGRIALLLGFFFFIYQTYWNSFYTALCVILGSMVGFFKPNLSPYKEYVYIIVEAVVYLSLSYFLYIWNLPLGVRSVIALIFVVVLMYPYLMQKHIVKGPRIAMLVTAIFTAIFFFSPPTKRVSTPFSKKEIFELIPYQITNINFNEENFIFYKSILPFQSQTFLPKRSEIKDKIVVLGLTLNQTQIISYLEQLKKESHPFLVIVSRQKNNPTSHNNALSLLKRKSFWNFDIYYPDYFAESIDFNENLPKDWRLKYFSEKIDNFSSEEIQNTLENTIKFSSGDLRKDAFDIKHLYYESFASYAKYYHNIGQNKLALDSITVARKFDSPKPNLLRIAYNSLKFTTPESTYIPILEDLTADPEFQEFSWNSLIPMYESIGDWNNALKNMALLERYYRSKDLFDLANELELVRVRLYINLENWKEVEPIIVSKLREQPDSVIWERLKSELIEKKDSYKRISTRPDAREARIQ